MKYFVFLFIFLFIPLVSADFYAGNFQQNKPINLLFDCSYNGTYCPESTNCSVSRVQYPNGSLMFTKANLSTAFYPSFNLTLIDSSILGSYSGRQSCCVGTECGDEDFTFDITPKGVKLQDGEGTISVIIIISVFIVALSLFVFGIFLRPSLVKLFIYGLSAIFLIAGIGFTVSISNTYLVTNESLNTTFSNFLFLLGVLAFGLFVIVLFISVAKVIMELRKSARFSS